MKVFFVLILLLSQVVHADELKIHLFKSPLGINWKTPWKLATSTLVNQIAPVGNRRAFSISHVFVEVKCDSVNKHIFRGMTSATTTEERDLLFRQHYGLGIMFHRYVGLLEKEDTILGHIEDYRGDKRRSELSYEISSNTCQRLLDYAQEYEDLGYGNYYSGLQGDPLKREGSGCSAFAVSFLRVGGLMSDFTEEWKQKIDVPLRLIGGPMTGNKVKLLYLLSRPGAKWSSKEPHYHLEAWDPEKMHSWLKRTYREVRDGSYESDEKPLIMSEGKSRMLKFNYVDRPTPSGPFWLN